MNHLRKLATAAALLGLGTLGLSAAQASTAANLLPAIATPQTQAPIVKTDGGSDAGTRATLARRLEQRLKAWAIRDGRDPSRIRVDPETVPFNISGEYARHMYYDFYHGQRKN